CPTLDSVGQGSVLPSVVKNEISFFSERDQSEQEEKEVTVLISLSNGEGLKCIENPQALDPEIADELSVCPEDVSSQGCNASKLQEESSVQHCQVSNAVKPKRRLRPASSVMLRNVHILDIDDASEMPKGKRGEKEDDRKRTQGSISLLRLLKQNIHR
ncbi:hypothetical protein Ccrd_013836, partial [Cynara cardunculus var. scolymus]